MKKRAFLKSVLLSMLMVMVLAPTAIAGKITVSRSAYSYGTGGEFVVTGIGPSSVYSPYTSTATSFQTFCLEKNELFTPGTPYNYTNDTFIVKATGAADPPGTSLTIGTAWLYFQFATATLDGYAFTGTQAQRAADAGRLQATIWVLQGYTIPGFDTLNEFYVKVLDEFGSLAAAQADYAGAYGVRVLNLFDDAGNPKQSHLYVPEPASLFLLGFGILAAAAFRRKVKRS